MIVLAAVFFLGMGCFALASPAALIRPFGITLPIPESRAEVRAVYGGFGLAIAAMLALALTGHPAREGILITVAAALGGMAFGRLVSWLRLPVVRHCGGRQLAEGATCFGSPMFWLQRRYPEPPPIRQ